MFFTDVFSLHRSYIYFLIHMLLRGILILYDLGYVLFQDVIPILDKGLWLCLHFTFPLFDQFHSITLPVYQEKWLQPLGNGLSSSLNPYKCSKYYMHFLIILIYSQHLLLLIGFQVYAGYQGLGELGHPPKFYMALHQMFS